MSLSPREVVVTETGTGLGTRIETGRHVLVADEPVSSGGADSGPDPYALMLGALGACTAMTLRLYANHKAWPLERVSVRLSHERIHAR
ncbi:MAG TPA: OsmC family protein, partial [Thermoanaerobaculia bacterium]